MKALFISAVSAVTLFTASLLSGCHKLDMEVKTQLTSDVFPSTPQHFAQVAGQVYSQFRQVFSREYFFLQSESTDEMIMPARGGNWYDGGYHEQLHYHTWNRNHSHNSWVWYNLSTTISLANQSLFLINKAPESAAKNTGLAEVRTMRAITYYMMMDLWGNIPLVTQFGDTTSPVTTKRAEVFNFIENEVKLALPYLNKAVGQETYGRPNKYTAFALLARMYLNAQVYNGTNRYNDVVAMCDSIITAPSAPYALETDYRKMFNINNGPAIKEFIFAVPYDNGVTDGTQFHARYTIPRSMRARFSLPYVPSGPMSTLPEYYAYFNDANDVRNGQWLTGLQYYYDGRPVTVATTKKGYDQTYTGSDGGSAYTYHVNITRDVILRDATRPFDVGNDEIAWHMGYRNNKFYPDSTSTTRNQGNDIPMFRYADVLLMKAEAILRGANATNGQTALSLVNALRAVRTTSAPWTTVSLENIYAERCREFAWESIHRTDMIRFGKFEGSWGFKTDGDVRKRIFPIPNDVMILNTKLDQNPGYF